MLINMRNAMMAGSKQPVYWGLCFTAEQANSVVRMTTNGTPPSVDLLFSTDSKTWSPFVVGSTAVNLANVGDRVWIKAGEIGNTSFASSATNFNRFNNSGKLSVSGNILSLLDGDDASNVNSLRPYCFLRLFSGKDNGVNKEKSLISARNLLLPAATLGTESCRNMFSYSLTLVEPPLILPATTLGNGCYGGMFAYCSSLVSAPQLPATNLANYCYNEMFIQDFSLVQIPSLPAKSIKNFSYQNMFKLCTEITDAMDIAATSAGNNGLWGMFNGCSRLKSVRTSLTSFSGTTDWLNGVSAEGTFYCPTALGTESTIARGGSACPTGWTVVNMDAT